MSPVTVIGMFREIGGYEYRPIKELLAAGPIANKATILKYLKSADVVGVSPSMPTDVISGERIPGELLMYRDRKFAWRSDIIYYFDKYNLKLPEDFIKQALAA